MYHGVFNSSLKVTIKIVVFIAIRIITIFLIIFQYIFDLLDSWMRSWLYFIRKWARCLYILVSGMLLNVGHGFIKLRRWHKGGLLIEYIPTRNMAPSFELQSLVFIDDRHAGTGYK